MPTWPHGAVSDAASDVTFTLAEADLRDVLLGLVSPDEPARREGVRVTGSIGALTTLLSHLSDPDDDFAIVTP
ncbi:alkyl sulfatase C-terminal domain-containing protein [Streptomyces bungoensis]